VKNRAVKRKGERHLAALPLVLNRRVELAEEADFALVAEPHHVARLKPPSRLRERTPARSVEPPMQRRLDPGLLTTADPPADKPGRDHACVVDHERIARLQQIGQVAHGAVFSYTTRAYDQQPRRIPRGYGTQRNPLGRQVEVEKIGAHREPMTGRSEKGKIPKC